MTTPNPSTAHDTNPTGRDGTHAREVDLAAVRARAEAATEGPWTVEQTKHAKAWERCDIWGVRPDIEIGDGDVHVAEVRTSPEQADAEFIAHARTDVPALLALVAEKDAENERQASLIRAIEDSRLDPARAIVKADRLAGEAIIRAHNAEAERDAAVARLGAIAALADEWRENAIAIRQATGDVNDGTEFESAADMLLAVLADSAGAVTNEQGCACGGMAACRQCQERDADVTKHEQEIRADERDLIVRELEAIASTYRPMIRKALLEEVKRINTDAPTGATS